MRAIVLLFAFYLAGCAATYAPPESVAPQASSNVSATVSAPRAEILRVAKRVLVTEGFQLTNADDSAGIVSTALRSFRVSPEQANCGTTMGLDYLKDNRTATRVGFGIIIADNNQLTVKAIVEAEYKPSDLLGMQNITLTCVSRGMLERAMMAKIISGL